MRNHFVSWYRKQIKNQLKERVLRYDKRIGVTVRDIRISDLGHRWASCGRNGAINFNWRSVMAPVWVFDYILVHEMVHMIERGNFFEFYGELFRTLSKNVDLIDLSGKTTKFKDIILREGRLVYDKTSN